MEPCFANIINGVVVSVEVVTDEFVKTHPGRYNGLWIKVGTENQKYVGKEYVLIPGKNKIIESKPFDSWILDEKKEEWVAPTIKPNGSYYWDEKTQKWIKE